MGMHLRATRLTREQCTAIDGEADAIQGKPAPVARSGDDRVLELGRDGHVIEAALRVASEGPAAEAIFAPKLGREVGSDVGYGYCPHYLSPEHVATVSRDLDAINRPIFPMPDPDGYAPDPRLETDDVLRRVAHQLAMVGGDPDNFEMMQQLERDFDRLRQHYRVAARAGEGMLLFLR